jgi:hypothetical protein
VRWHPGDVIQWREIWHGQVLLEFPVRVVADRDDLLALFIAEGTPFAFPEPWPWAPAHPWASRGRWQGHGVLILHRPGDAYAVWLFWEGLNRSFAGWYVNLQAPLRRGERSIETFDHELDIDIHPDGTWRWKDDELLDERVREGRFTVDDAAAIRATGRQVVREIEGGERWWDGDWPGWQLGD